MLRRLRTVVVGVFLAGASWFLLQVPSLKLTGDLVFDYEAARAAADPALFRAVLGRAEEARTAPRVAAMAGRVAAAARAALADTSLKEGDYEEARALLRALQETVEESDAIGRFNIQNLRVLLQVVAGERTAGAVQRVIDSLQSMLERGYRLEADSVDATFSDLFLALRACGSRAPAPGDPRRYRPTARLLAQLETAKGSGQIPVDFRDAVRKDLEEWALRRDLLRLVLADPSRGEELEPLREVLKDLGHL